jgi:hypothetical protein
MTNEIRNYAELRTLIRISLRAQHPEWIDPNGNSPICDEYEKRFAVLLGLANAPETDRSRRQGNYRSLGGAIGER